MADLSDILCLVVCRGLQCKAESASLPEAHFGACSSNKIMQPLTVSHVLEMRHIDIA